MKAVTQYECEHDIEGLVAAACRLVGSDNGVRSVRVLTPSRPTYDELWCYREWAHDQHVRLNVDGNGMVTVRQECDPEESLRDRSGVPHLPPDPRSPTRSAPTVSLVEADAHQRQHPTRHHRRR